MPRPFNTAVKLLFIIGLVIMSFSTISLRRDIYELQSQQTKTIYEMKNYISQFAPKEQVFWEEEKPAIHNPSLDVKHYTGAGRIDHRKSNGRFITTKLHGIVAGGGLGNQLFELVSLLGIADSLERTPYLAASNTLLMMVLESSILPRFPHLLEQFQLNLVPPSWVKSVDFNLYACCKYENVDRIKGSHLGDYLHLEGAYFQSFKYFHQLRPLIRDWLSPHWLAEKRADSLIPLNIRDDFIICTHIRRGDFISDGMHLPSDERFTRTATEYVVRKHSSIDKNISVVVLGNDIPWGRTVFADKLIMNAEIRNNPMQDTTDYRVVLTPTLSPEIDLALSRQFCNAVIITAPSSTFGWWLGYLSKEQSVVYYRDIEQTEDQVLRELTSDDFYPPDWIKLQTTFDGSILGSNQ